MAIKKKHHTSDISRLMDTPFSREEFLVALEGLSHEKINNFFCGRGCLAPLRFTDQEGAFCPEIYDYISSFSSVDREILTKMSSPLPNETLADLYSSMSFNARLRLCNDPSLFPLSCGLDSNLLREEAKKRVLAAHREGWYDITSLSKSDGIRSFVETEAIDNFIRSDSSKIFKHPFLFAERDGYLEPDLIAVFNTMKDSFLSKPDSLPLSVKHQISSNIHLSTPIGTSNDVLKHNCNHEAVDFTLKFFYDNGNGLNRDWFKKEEEAAGDSLIFLPDNNVKAAVASLLNQLPNEYWFNPDARVKYSGKLAMTVSPIQERKKIQPLGLNLIGYGFRNIEDWDKFFKYLDYYGVRVTNIVSDGVDSGLVVLKKSGSCSYLDNCRLDICPSRGEYLRFIQSSDSLRLISDTEIAKLAKKVSSQDGKLHKARMMRL